MPVAILASLVVLLSIGLIMTLVTRPGGGVPGAGSTPTTLAQAVDECDQRPGGYAGELGDNGTTLYFDMKGEEPNSGKGKLEALVCLLVALEAPDRIIREMEHTRALDGRQEAQWGSYTVSWRYHPDDGLDVLITEASS